MSVNITVTGMRRGDRSNRVRLTAARSPWRRHDEPDAGLRHPDQ
ncbi:MAG TPA: hypothetical protein VES01_00900 [Dermatophilaceae bacterium]|nr:hypothetical protein [Dermatophilaceae bacterium]